MTDVRPPVPISAWTCYVSGSVHELGCTSLPTDWAPCLPCLSLAWGGGWAALVVSLIPRPCPCPQEMIITNLQPETAYSITVAAYTMKGDGARSKPKVVVTKGAGARPSMAPLPSEHPCRVLEPLLVGRMHQAGGTGRAKVWGRSRGY